MLCRIAPGLHNVDLASGHPGDLHVAIAPRDLTDLVNVDAPRTCLAELERVFEVDMPSDPCEVIRQTSPCWASQIPASS
jgi:hypothetical protein